MGWHGNNTTIYHQGERAEKSHPSELGAAAEGKGRIRQSLLSSALNAVALDIAQVRILPTCQLQGHKPRSSVNQMSQHLTQITSLAEYVACIKVTAGKTILLAFWPGDSTSTQVIKALHKLLPRESYAQHEVVDAYCFDMYSLPELGTELEVTFVPMLMFFNDGVMDPIVWHEGVAMEGESVEKGVKRVVDRVKGAEIAGEGSDDDW